MTDATSPAPVPQYTNGSDIHFDYGSDHPDLASDHHTASSSKKKKKKKNKKKSHFEPTLGISTPDGVDAILNNPEDDYPTSRVIKQAPNGDVIVESMDPVPPAQPPPFDVWFQTTNAEEKTNLKKFWESLSTNEKKEIAFFDKEDLVTLFKSYRHNPKMIPQPAERGHRESLTAPSSSCTCAHCGRRRGMILDEVEKLFDEHAEDIKNFIQEVKDIDELNTLPKLLFGGFHKLEDEHKLFKRHRRLNAKTTLDSQPRIQEVNDTSADQTEDLQHNNDVTESPRLTQPETTPEDANGTMYDSMKELYLKGLSDKLKENNQISEEKARILTKMFDPKIYEALNNLDFDKPKEITYNDASTLDNMGPLREFVSDLRNADKAELEQSMSFIEHMAKMSSIDLNSPNSQQKAARVLDHINGQLSTGLSNFADDLLKNNGGSFVSMLESLSESRTAREGMLKDLANDSFPPDPAMANNQKSATEYHKKLVDQFDKLQNDRHDDEGEDDELYEEEYESEFDEEDLIDEDNDDDLSNTESEISEEEKMQEIRQLFMMQTINLFQRRLRIAYKEKLSQDRTQKLIEELEAEENAKKERELKKLRQKEKAKEKKRLQQLAKEEERQRKEEERKAKEEEQRLKQEALKAEQRRRKEEAQRKKEEEKQKRIEELKKKELEQQKKLELQRQREAEERQKKAEERQKETEERQKEESRKRNQEEQRRKEQEQLHQQEEQRKRDEARLEKQRQEEQILKAESQKQQEFVAQFERQTLNNEPGSAVAEPGLVEPLIEEDPLSQSGFTNNPLLEQLYQANSRSLSSTPKNTSTLDSNFGIQPPAIGAVNNSNIWYNGSTSLSNGNNAPILNQAFPNAPAATQFTPFSSFTKKDSYQMTDPFAAAPAVSAPPPGLASQSASSTNLWASSNTRNNAIWNSTPKPTTAPSIWGNSMLNNGASNTSNGLGGITSNNSPGLSAQPQIDVTLIQSSALQAYQFLQTNSKLEFGMAPSVQLYQYTQSLLPNSNLNYNQFINSCAQANEMVNYRFEFMYDDLGTVSHIKAVVGDNGSGILRSSPGPIPRHLLGTTPPGFNLNANKPQMSTMLGSLNDSMGVKAPRGLWN